jgi:YVTN family beta-propeller protein
MSPGAYIIFIGQKIGSEVGLRLLFIVCAFFSFFADAKSAETYHEVARYKLGGEGGWDLLTLDDKGDRLYVSRSNRIMVIDTHTGKLIGEVADIDGSHGITLVPKANLGFATAGKAGTVVVFDLTTLKATSIMKVGEKPDAIIYDLFSDKVFSFNGKSEDVSVIDPKSMKVTSTIKLQGKPELAVSDEKGNIFVNFEDKSSFAVIDTKKFKIIHTYPLKPCEEPTGIALDKASHHLFVGCGNKMAAMVDGLSGKVLKTLPVGDGVDGAEFFPAGRLAFIPSGKDGKVSIFEENGSTFELVQELTTQKGSRTIALDNHTGRIFLAAAEFGTPASNGHERPPMVPGSFSILVYGGIQK